VIAHTARRLQDPDKDARINAASLLGFWQNKDHIPGLVGLLRDPDAKVRLEAVSSLTQVGAKDGLAGLLRDPNAEVRSAAVSSLAQLGAKEQIPALVKLLHDADPEVRATAAHAMGTLKAWEQALAVAELLQDEFDSVRQAAASALLNLGPQPRTIVITISDAYYFNRSLQSEARFLSYYVTGGDPKTRLLVRRVMFHKGQHPPSLSSAEANETLQAFADILPAKRADSYFADEADRQILHRWRLPHILVIARHCSIRGAAREDGQK
jgi:hypothetical protein